MTIKYILTTLLVLVLCTFTFSQVISIAGTYQGKNLYVQNPFTGNLKDFCTNDVYVNGVKVMSNPKSSAYEVDLSHIALNSEILIKVTHKGDCQPKILNPQVIRSKSKFAFSSFNVDEKSVNWATKGERANGEFFIQQFVNNNWTNVKNLNAKGGKANSYSVEAEHHSGINKYRIKYLEEDSQTFYSKVVNFQSTKKPVDFWPRKVTDYVNFSAQTNYEIYDKYGNRIKKGKGQKVDCTDLKGHEVYTIVFDNQTKSFLKKEKSTH